jgi:hypothetical protein
MVLVIHIVSALVSMASASYLLFKLSRPLVRLTYGLMTSTLVTGTYLVISRHLRLLNACMAGLSYLSFVSIALAISQWRLAKVNVPKQDN